MLNVRMLGGLSIFLDDRRLPLELGVSGRLLAGFLFEFPSRASRREWLAELFWPDLPMERARSALNTAVWRLRKTLALEPESRGGRNLVSNREEVILEQADWMAVDTHAFDRLAECQSGGPVLTESEVSRLEAAVGFYGGPFLDGDDLQWVLEERERLHSLYVRALSDLVRSYAMKQQYERAIRAARRILSVDRFRESVQRQLMLLLFLNDQRVEAILQYRQWLRMLHEEMDIKPMPQTQALAELLFSGTLVENVTTWITREFVGRPLSAAQRAAP